jgi:hypothetical protein
MGRQVDVDELVGAAEITSRLTKSGRTSIVHDWRRRDPEFPQPVVTLQAGLEWAWPDVAKWAKVTGREIKAES